MSKGQNRRIRPLGRVRSTGGGTVVVVVFRDLDQYPQDGETVYIVERSK